MKKDFFKPKHMIGLIGAFTMAFSAFEGISATAATEKVYIDEDYSDYSTETNLIPTVGEDYTWGNIIYSSAGRNGSKSSGDITLNYDGTIKIQETKYSSNGRGPVMTFSHDAGIPTIADLENDTILKLSFDIKGSSGAFEISGYGRLTLSDLGITESSYSTVCLELDKFWGRQTLYVNDNKISEEDLMVEALSGFKFQDTTDTSDMQAVNFSMDNIKVECTKSDADESVAHYTVKYVDTNGESIRSDSSRIGVIGTLTSLYESDYIINSIEKYILDGLESKAIAADGSTVITLTYRKANVYNMKAVASVDTSKVLASANVIEGESFSYSYPKYITDSSARVIASNNDSIFTRSVTPIKSENIEIQYDKYIKYAYFAEHENIDSSIVDYHELFSDGSASRASSEGATAFSIEESGIYDISVMAMCRNAGLSSVFAIYKNSVSEDNLIFNDDVKGVSINKINQGVRKVSDVILEKGDVIIIQGDSSNTWIDYILAEKHMIEPSYTTEIAGIFKSNTNEPAAAAFTADVSSGSYNVKGLTWNLTKNGKTTGDIPAQSVNIAKGTTVTFGFIVSIETDAIDPGTINADDVTVTLMK